MRHHLRVAFGTDRLDEVVAMYRDGLGFEVLGDFDDHDGFDGVMLGHLGSDHHLEFTTHRGEPAGGVPGPDDLLVFYVTDPLEWERACERAEGAGFVRVTAVNPYWERSGATYADVDGRRVVLQSGEWPLNPSG
jgi:catechol 2,3-dioxygenase-like lactoylglutathione lyase family enzyme